MGQYRQRLPAVDTMTTITVGIDTSRSYNRKVPPGGICSDLFSSAGQRSEEDNKSRRIDRQRSSIDFAPDPSEVTKGLDRQISEPIQGKRVDYQSPPQDKNSGFLTKAERETKPTEIDGKIKSNGMEAKSTEAKPENTDVKNSSVNDKSSQSEAKPAVAESAMKNTSVSADSTKAKSSQPEPGQTGDVQPDKSVQVERVESAKDRNEPTNVEKVEPAKDRNDPTKVEKVEPAKDINEPVKVEKVEPAKDRNEPTEVERVKPGKFEKPSVPMTRTTRRVPPGGHCSQLW